MSNEPNNEEEQIDYSDIVPKEIRMTVESLGKGDTDSKFAILIILLDSEECLSKNDISKKGDFDDDINQLLDHLQRSGLVARKVGERLGDPSTGEYVITTYGKRILDGFYRATQPKFTDLVISNKNNK